MPSRFKFGKNWKNFLTHLNDARIDEAVESLKTMLGADSLRGKSFLDIGSGSGLFSLAAHRLGARVHSFDYDADSVACTESLRDRYGDKQSWKVEQGSALDEAYLKSLGKFDVVYSWGVLHHTGDMWKALEHAADTVSPKGLLFLAIYNDQGAASRSWTWVKRQYNHASAPIKLFWVLAVGFFFEVRTFLIRILKFQNPFQWNPNPARGNNRGMTWWNDLVDWVGGYPFEVARPDELTKFYSARGFSLKNLKTVGKGHGCNEFIFYRER